MEIKLKATRVTQGGRTYFMTKMKFSELSRIEYVEDVQGWRENPKSVELTERLQRPIDEARVTLEIVPYLLKDSSYHFGAVTVMYARRPDAVGREIAPLGREIYSETERALILDDDVLLFYIDGQHRGKAIEYAIKKSAALRSQEIAIELLSYKGIDDAHKLFADMNTNQARLKKFQEVAFGGGPYEIAARVAADEVPLFRGNIEPERDRVPNRSSKIFAMPQLVQFFDILYPSHRMQSDDVQEAIGRLTWLTEYICDVVRPLGEFRSHRIDGFRLRENYVAGHIAPFTALLAISWEGMIQYPPEGGHDTRWAQSLGGLAEVDWRRTNKGWEYFLQNAGQIENRKDTTRLVEVFLKHVCKIPIQSKDAKAFETLRRRIEAGGSSLDENTRLALGGNA